jgi:DNA mismatch endonuclease (patch repair protein)
MSRIRSKDTKPEIIVRKFLFSKGFRYRLNDKKLPGKPDIVLPRYRTVIFIHGCFWHGHENCRYFVVPKTRTEWWLNKIHTNQANDLKAMAALREAGWNVLILWECALKGEHLNETLSKLPSILVS